MQKLLKSIRDELMEFFDGDHAKVELWLVTPNEPLLGGFVPRDMIFAGKGEKLLRYIRQAKAENEL